MRSNTFFYSPRVYGSFLRKIEEAGRPVEIITADGTRKLTREITNAHLHIKNPRDRLVLDSARKMNVAFAIAEWVGLMVGTDSAAYFSQFIADYGRFSSDPNTILGAYGPRIARSGGQTQIERVCNALMTEPQTRRAVITIYDGKFDLASDPRDVPCTLGVQFLYREDKLDAIVTMRSSDIYWGLTYDAFQFSMLQEWIARQINAEVGMLYFNAGSLHLYEPYFGAWKQMEDPRWPFLMTEMPKVDIAEVYRLWDALWPIHAPEFDTKVKLIETRYFRNLAYTARAWAMRQTDVEKAVQAYFQIKDDKTLRRSVRPSLEIAGALEPKY